jgi:hypothetical protein
VVFSPKRGRGTNHGRKMAGRKEDDEIRVPLAEASGTLISSTRSGARRLMGVLACQFACGRLGQTTGGDMEERVYDAVRAISP